MIKRLRFSLLYALRNLWRDRQRTLFALFSIAAGVSTVVALRMLGLMLTDALTDNVRALMRGDIVVSSGGGMRISFLNPDQDAQSYAFTDRNITQIQRWAERNNAEATFVASGELTQVAVVKDERAGRPAFAQGIFIDPQTYPFYDTIRATDPSQELFKNLFTGPNQVVVCQRIADQLDIHVGDQLRIGTSKELHTVQGIVPDTAESSFNSPLNLLFGFIYIDRAYAEQFNIPPNSADTVYLKFPAGTDLAFMQNKIYQEWSNGRGVRVRTVDQVLENNQVSSLLISRFILLLSLIAPVIGGVGIVNTMLVSVNRRANEIAVLKTLGVKSGGISQIFLFEALFMGVLGSLLGVVIGFGLSLIARDFGERAFGFPLPWHFQLDPAVLGLGMGIVITIIFSVLPTLMASQVRPGLVLRQGALVLARAGCLPSLLSLIALIVGLGTLVGLIIGDIFTLFETQAPASVRMRGVRVQNPILWLSEQLPPGLAPIFSGIVGVVVLFLIFAVILGLAWLVVWALGKLPSLRNPDLRLAIRGLTVYRTRTALSLLALVIGMTALSSTLILSRSINQLLYTTLSGPLGGNVVVLPLLPLTDNLVKAQLNTELGSDDVRGYRTVRIPNVDLIAINGDRDFESKLAELSTNEVSVEFAQARLQAIVGMDVAGAPTRGRLYAGRYLNAEDSGQRVMTIPYDPLLESLGVEIGSKLTYRIAGKNVDFEVVGIVAPDVSEGLIPFSLGDRAAQVPLNTVSSTMPFDFVIADVSTAKVNDVMAVVGAVPGVFVFDVGVFDTFLNRLFSQIAALPLLVAALSLFAAAVLIATTVSLATLERRRQIGILKALGVKRRQALGQLLVENGLVGFTGGVISLLPTLLILAAVPALTQNVIVLPIPTDLIALMLGLAIVITLGATLLTAWGASGEKPLTVLRYE